MTARRRTATAIRFDPELYDRLIEAADERDVSINWLVNKAVADFLPRLLPADEIQWTRPALDRVGTGSPSGSDTTQYPLLPAPTAGSGEGSDRPPPG